MATRKPADAAPAAKKAPAFKLPKTIGACADLLYQTRESRLDLQHDAKDLEAREKAIKEHLVNTLPKSETTGVAGKLARVAVTTDEVNQVEDWDKFYAYIKKTGFFHLLGRTIKQEAIDEILASGKKIPGVKKFPVVKVSCTKV
jgi:hypothetical protein